MNVESASISPGTYLPCDPPGTAKYAQDLSRSLTFKENILITLSGVTPASSVFIIAPAAISGIGGAAAVAFAIAALIGMVIAFCYAELSSSFPIAGGDYTIIARTLGKPYGLAFLFLSMACTICILGVVASGVGTYLGVVWKGMDSPWTGIVVILATAVVACFNIKANAWVTGIFLFLEVAALAVLAVLGFVHATQPVSVLWHATTMGPHGILVGASAGLVVSFTATALFAYNGYNSAVYYAEETKRARTTIGRAILWSLAITVAAEFIPVIAVLLGTPSMSGLLGAADPMSYFLRARGGCVVNEIVSIGVAIAVINALLANIILIGRLFYSSARDRTWPDWINRPLASVHPKLRTPVAATLVVGVAGALCVWLLPFNVLLIVSGAYLLVQYLLVGLAALVGRISGSTRKAEYRMPWWPIPPIAMVLATVVVIYESVIAAWLPVVVTLGIYAIALPYYFLYLKPRAADRWTLPEPADEENGG
ncbi:APC family permease [Rhodanobacter sp. Si-c]|uniref:APC family permease n=1 Tax=Rhodanobacter lycopersici TaxID=3162487 RepID=A0ABV3QH38_9GAMM